MARDSRSRASLFLIAANRPPRSDGDPTSIDGTPQTSIEPARDCGVSQRRIAPPFAIGETRDTYGGSSPFPSMGESWDGFEERLKDEPNRPFWVSICSQTFAEPVIRRCGASSYTEEGKQETLQGWGSLTSIRSRAGSSFLAGFFNPVCDCKAPLGANQVSGARRGSVWASSRPSHDSRGVRMAAARQA